MSGPALFVLIYSELLVYEGGRTTWLSYFLPRVAASGAFRELHVVHMRPSLLDDALPVRLAAREGAPLRFHAASLGVHGDQRPSQRFAAFARRALATLSTWSAPGDVVLAVGAHGEALPSLGGLLLGRLRRRRLKLITWLREASLGQVRLRRGRAVHAAASALYGLQLRASARVIANGADTADHHLRAFPWLAARLHTIPNGVDASRFDDAEPLDLSARPLRVGFCGRLIEVKGFFDLAGAAEQLEDAPLRFLAWGPAHEPSAAYQAVVERPPAGLELRPPLLPDEVPAALASCHVHVQLTRSLAGEGAGGVSHSLLESMACGRLIVAWDSPVYRQVLDDASALFVPEGDLNALCAAFQSALDPAQAEAHQARARRARELALDYDCEVHVARFLEAIADLV